jgi:hypothetical protein
MTDAPDYWTRLSSRLTAPGEILVSETVSDDPATWVVVLPQRRRKVYGPVQGSSDLSDAQILSYVVGVGGWCPPERALFDPGNWPVDEAGWVDPAARPDGPADEAPDQEAGSGTDGSQASDAAEGLDPGRAELAALEWLNDQGAPVQHINPVPHDDHVEFVDEWREMSEEQREDWRAISDEDSPIQIEWGETDSGSPYPERKWVPEDVVRSWMEGR